MGLLLNLRRSTTLWVGARKILWSFDQTVYTHGSVPVD